MNFHDILILQEENGVNLQKKKGNSFYILKIEVSWKGWMLQIDVFYLKNSFVHN